MICPLCARDVKTLDRHHLKTRRKDQAAVEEICQPCHSQIHALFTNTELRDPRLELDTVEGLMANARMAKAIKFIAKQPAAARVSTRASNNVKRR